MDQNTHIIKNTKKWIADFVIQLDLCPFAHISFDQYKIEYQIGNTSDLRSILTECYQLIVKLQSELEWSNAFYIIDSNITFDELLEVKDILDSFLEESNIDSEFQTVVFHPDFQFDGDKDFHAGNFVNRSPYPMLHILRTEEVGSATKSLSDPESIPNINKEKLEKLGYDYLYTSLETYRK